MFKNQFLVSNVQIRPSSHPSNISDYLNIIANFIFKELIYIIKKCFTHILCFTFHFCYWLSRHENLDTTGNENLRVNCCQFNPWRDHNLKGTCFLKDMKTVIPSFWCASACLVIHKSIPIVIHIFLTMKVSGLAVESNILPSPSQLPFPLPNILNTFQELSVKSCSFPNYSTTYIHVFNTWVMSAFFFFWKDECYMCIYSSERRSRQL